MDKDQLRQLLERYKAGIATEEETQQLNDWYEGLASTGSNKVPEQQHLDGLLHRIHQQITIPVKRRPALQPYWYVAAAAVLVLLFSVGWWLWSTQNTDFIDQRLAQNIAVPAGSLYKIVLPDSSKVWLSGGSQLQYAGNFGERKRIVRLLKGKAFFDVQKKAESPFIVEAGHLHTLVLGTSFTVDLATAPVIAVATGSVQVSSDKILQTLTPGQKLAVNAQTGDYVVETLPADLVNAWTLKEFAITGYDFNELALAFHAFYGIQLQAANPALKGRKYNIILKRDIPAEKVLAVLCRLYENKYKLRQDGSYLVY